METSKQRQVVLYFIFIILCAVIIIPFIMLVSVSFDNENMIAHYGYSLIPKQFDLSAYKYIFNNPQSIIDAYKVTIIYSFAAAFLSTLLQSMLAYSLSKIYFKGRNVISFVLYFTMMFNGGMVASYILYTKYLHIGDTIWIYILTGLVSPWNVFMIRSFMQNLPEGMMESARVDGASEVMMYTMFALPLTKPVLATVAFTTLLAKWNDWATAMIYINNEKLVSLQYLLQRILQNIELIQNSGTDVQNMMSVADIPSESTRMAMAVIAIGPMLFVFPFFQKYFVRGMTVGSVKG